VLRIAGFGKNRPVILAKKPGLFGKKGHPFPDDLRYTPATGRRGCAKSERITD
jgi:hypothetical protein